MNGIPSSWEHSFSIKFHLFVTCFTAFDITSVIHSEQVFLFWIFFWIRYFDIFINFISGLGFFTLSKRGSIKCFFVPYAFDVIIKDFCVLRLRENWKLLRWFIFAHFKKCYRVGLRKPHIWQKKRNENQKNYVKIFACVNTGQFDQPGTKTH